MRCQGLFLSAESISFAAFFSSGCLDIHMLNISQAALALLFWPAM